MTIKQISVFLENKSGRINEVTQALSAASINMHAFSMSETTDFGILRLVVSNVDKAVQVLQDAHFAVVLTDVVCISCDNVPGSLAKIIDRLTAKDIFIEYMYAFAQGEKANIVIRPTDLSRCMAVLEESDCDVLCNSNL